MSDSDERNTVSPERASRCVTHHYACDCREHKHQQILDALRRARKFVEQDVLMIADLTRHAPLPKEAQEIHDTTEYESEILLQLIDKLLGEADEQSPKDKQGQEGSGCPVEGVDG